MALPSPHIQEIINRFGELDIDFTAHRLVRNNREVPLTRTEWALLEQLVRNAGMTLTHRMLLQRVWGDNYSEEREYLRVYIGRLRRKLIVRAALHWAVEREEAEMALRLSGALWWFWVMHTSLNEGQRWIAQALMLPGDVPLAVRAKALHGAGGLAWAQGDYAAAIASFEASLALRRTLADKRGVAGTLNNLGLVAIARGDNKRALTFFEENLGLFRELEDQRGIASSLSNLGWAAMECADYVRAGESFQESLLLRRALQDQWGIAASLTNLGWVALRRGALEEAEFSFKEGLGFWHTLDDKASMAECLEGFAGLLTARGQAVQAAQIAGAAASIRDLARAPMTPAYL